MRIGKWNFVAGSIGLVLAGIGGALLGATFNDNSLKDGYHMLTEARFYLREGHSHGMPMAMLNLIFGLYVDRLTLSALWKKIGSIGALLAFFLPIGLAAQGAAGAPANFPPIGMIGVLGFFAATITLTVGALKFKTQATA